MLYSVIFIFIFVFVIFIAFILNSRTKIKVEYTRTHGYGRLYLTFYLIYEIIKLRYKVPLEEIQSDGLRLVRVKKGEAEKEEVKKKIKKKKRKGLNFVSIYEKMKSIKCFYDLNSKHIKDIADYIRKKLVVEELKLNASIGTNDAFYTGILGGLAWSVAGIFTSFICTNFRVLKKCINVQPNFSRKEVKIDFRCILRTKLVHIIVVRIKFYKFLKKKRNCKTK